MAGVPALTLVGHKAAEAVTAASVLSSSQRERCVELVGGFNMASAEYRLRILWGL